MEEESKKKKSSILIIGVTGRLGFELAKASLEANHPTFCLVRPSSFSEAAKSRKLEILSDSGAVILDGSLHDEGSLIKAIKQVTVVICAVNSKQVLDQKPLISAIKKAGCIEPGLKTSPRDKVTIFGDGNVKGVFMKERNVAAFTFRTVDDPRTLNKVLYLRPPGNVYSMNELVEMWEHKIGKHLEKIYVSAEDLLKKIKETPYPDNMEMVFTYAAFVKGFQTCFEVEASGGVEGSVLYPHLKYTTISNYLDTLL